jgi:hypothetical protein
MPIRQRLLAHLRILGGLVFLFTYACGGSDGSPDNQTPAAPSNSSLRLERLSTALSAPVFLTSPPGEAGRLFVVERAGLIRILDRTTGSPRPIPFLDIRSMVSTDGERGFLGMAFAPDYSASRRFFVFYTDLAGTLTIA